MKYMSKLLGYTLCGSNNGYNMFKNITLDECSKYSNIYAINRIDPAFKFKKRKNYSTTYDGFTIVSERFKQFCIDEKYTGLEFIKLPSSLGFYWFKIENVIEYDSEARKTRFIGYNKSCDGYEEIIGANPACLKNNIILNDSFFRSNIFFSSDANKRPLEMVGESTMQKLKAAGFKEIFFEKILDEYQWQKEGKDPNKITIKP